MAIETAPAQGWYVEVDHSGGATHRPAVIGEPSRNPKANALPTIQVPVPRDEKWQDTSFEDAPMRVWFDGVRQPIEQLDSVDIQTDRTVLTGVGGVELRDRVETNYTISEIHTEADNLIATETSYTPNVDAPQTDVDENQQVQTADTTTEYQNLLINSIPATKPVLIENSEVVLAQSAFFLEVEDNWAFAGAVSDAEASGGSTENLSFDRDDTAYVNLDYTLPSEALALAIRIRNPEDPDGDGIFEGFGFDTFVDGENMHSFGDVWGASNDDYTWFTQTKSSSDSDASGKTSITIDGSGSDPGDGKTYFDAVVLYDARYTYTLDNTVDSDGWLSGPQLYPDAEQQQFKDAEIAESVFGGRVESTWNDVSNNQQVELSKDQGDSWKASANTDTFETDFATAGPALRLRITLSRYGTRSTASPTTGFNAQAMDTHTLKADLSDMPIVVNQSYDGSLLSVLQDLAERGDFLFEYRDDGTTKSIEWSQPGQRIADQTPDVASYSSEKSTDAVYEKVIVYGKKQQRREEEITANHGTAVALNQDHLTETDETVYDPSTTVGGTGGTRFERGQDYEIDWTAGEITTKAGGSIDDGQTIAIDYWYRSAGEAVADGVTTPNRTLVKSIPGLTTDNGCGNAAVILVSNTKDPQRTVEVTIPNDQPGWSVVESINFDQVPIGPTALEILDVDNIPAQTKLQLGNRQSIADVVGGIQRRTQILSTRV